MKRFALFVAGLLFANVACAASEKSMPPAEQEDPNEVRIALMCGSLKGAGSVVIVDPVQQKIYRFDFVCPTTEKK